jgi:hypothetical protein
LLICDRLFEKAYYNYVIFTNTSDKLHKTWQTIEGEMKMKIEFVSDAKKFPYLQR